MKGPSASILMKVAHLHNLKPLDSRGLEDQEGFRRINRE